MDELFSAQSDTLMQLAAELKNVNLSLDDIQKSLNKPDEKQNKDVIATKVNTNTEGKPASDSDANYDALPATEANTSTPGDRPSNVTSEQQIQSIEVLNEETPELAADLDKQVEELFSNNRASVDYSSANNISYTTTSEQNNASNKPVVDNLNPTLKQAFQSNTSAEPPEEGFNNMIATEQTKTSQNEIAEQFNLDNTFKNINKLASNSEILEPKNIQKPDNTDNNLDSVNAALPVSQPKANSLQTNKTLEPANILLPKPSITKNNIFIQKPKEKINATAPEKTAAVNNVVSDMTQNTEPAPVSPVNDVVSDMTQNTENKMSEAKQLELQEENSLPSNLFADYKELQAINETERSITPVNTKDLSLVNLEKSVAALANAMNKNQTAIINQLASLNTVASEIMKILPSLNMGSINNFAGNGMQMNKQANVLNGNAIRDFRSLTTSLYSMNKMENRPTLT